MSDPDEVAEWMEQQAVARGVAAVRFISDTLPCAFCAGV
jgi:hypothetical protein